MKNIYKAPHVSLSSGAGMLLARNVPASACWCCKPSTTLKSFFIGVRSFSIAPRKAGHSNFI